MYNGLSEVYDRLMSDVDYDQWCKFIVEKCNISNKSNIIDAACGTGAITVRLAQTGANVTGVDSSNDMLLVASQNARKNGLNIAFAIMDIANLQSHKQADTVSCVCDGVNYLQDVASVRSFFDSAYGLLKSGGKLIFDISSEYKLTQILGNNLFFEDYDDLTYFWQNKLRNKKYLDMELCFFVKKGALYERFDEKHRQFIYSEKQLISMLNKSGFSNIQTYDCYTDKKVGKDTQRIVFLAEK